MKQVCTLDGTAYPLMDTSGIFPKDMSAKLSKLSITWYSVEFVIFVFLYSCGIWKYVRLSPQKLGLVYIAYSSCVTWKHCTLIQQDWGLLIEGYSKHKDGKTIVFIYLHHPLLVFAYKWYFIIKGPWTIIRLRIPFKTIALFLLHIIQFKLS